jgi:hypothetical protein
MATVAKGAFGPATLRVLEISYVCDISRDDGVSIPLGILADLRAQGVYGLGLVARKTLSEAEAEQVGGLIRAEVSTPFAYLSGVFKEVFNSPVPAEAFRCLPSKHALSLRFLRAKESLVVLPKPVKINLEARKLWVKDELHGTGNKAYWNMFGEQVPFPVEKESKEDLAA